MSIKSQIKSKAQELGFTQVGITNPSPPEHFPKFINWLNQGRHADMTYLASDRSLDCRADPKRILPECRSIIVLAAHYNAHQQYTIDDPVKYPTGKIASYAWGSDYHQVLVERLRELHQYIEELNGNPVLARWYTDTGPILERDIAQRSGLGWIGKNTCLISPNAGSYFFLAELLLGLDLEPDEPFTADYCGSCTRCLDACPTQCILPDRTLDAGNCISYLTIELKDAIPLHLRQQVGNWIFGCDICQQVCPWNLRFAPIEGEPSFFLGPERKYSNLTQEIMLTQQEFNLMFKDSPLKRAKRRGYLRNIAVALGNSRNRAAIPVLIEVLNNDPEPLVRGHAAWALSQFHDTEAWRALDAAQFSESDEYVLVEIQSALRSEVK